MSVRSGPDQTPLTPSTPTHASRETPASTQAGVPQAPTSTYTLALKLAPSDMVTATRAVHTHTQTHMHVRAHTYTQSQVHSQAHTSTHSNMRLHTHFSMRAPVCTLMPLRAHIKKKKKGESKYAGEG